jgi:hypothetical protein
MLVCGVDIELVTVVVDVVDIELERLVNIFSVDGPSSL